jgi:hypothetical protein
VLGLRGQGADKIGQSPDPGTHLFAAAPDAYGPVRLGTDNGNNIAEGPS